MYFYSEKELKPGNFCIIIPTQYHDEIIDVLLPEFNNKKYFIPLSEVSNKNSKLDNFLKIGNEFVAEIIKDGSLSLMYLNDKIKSDHMEKYQYYKRFIKFFKDFKLDENIIQQILNYYEETDEDYKKYIFDNSFYEKLEEKQPLYFIKTHINDILNFIPNQDEFKIYFDKKLINYYYQLALYFEVICIDENPINKINDFMKKLDNETKNKNYKLEFVKTPTFKIILKNQNKDVLNNDLLFFQNFIKNTNLKLLKTEIKDYSFHF